MGTIICHLACITDTSDILSLGADDMESFEEESFERISASLGLTERKPVPEPATFSDRDPLGRQLINPTTQDYIAQLGKCIHHCLSR